MELKQGAWFKEEWDEKAPEPGRTYYHIEGVDNGLVSLLRFAVFEQKPEMNVWARMDGIPPETVTRRLKALVSDAEEILHVQSAFEGLPESLETT